MADPISSPIEPLKDTGDQQITETQDSKASIFEIASGLEDALAHLLKHVKDADNEINSRIDKITTRLNNIENRIVKEGEAPAEE